MENNLIFKEIVCSKYIQNYSRYSQLGIFSNNLKTNLKDVCYFFQNIEINEIFGSFEDTNFFLINNIFYMAANKKIYKCNNLNLLIEKIKDTEIETIIQKNGPLIDELDVNLYNNIIRYYTDISRDNNLIKFIDSLNTINDTIKSGYYKIYKYNSNYEISEDIVKTKERKLKIEKFFNALINIDSYDEVNFGYGSNENIEWVLQEINRAGNNNSKQFVDIKLSNLLIAICILDDKSRINPYEYFKNFYKLVISRYKEIRDLKILNNVKYIIEKDFSFLKLNLNINFNPLKMIGGSNSSSDPNSSSDSNTDLSEEIYTTLRKLKKNNLSLHIDKLKNYIYRLKLTKFSHDDVNLKKVDFKSCYDLIKDIVSNLYNDNYSYNYTLLLVDLFTEMIEANFFNKNELDDFKNSNFPNELNIVDLNIFINYLNVYMCNDNPINVFIPNSDDVKKVIKLIIPLYDHNNPMNIYVNSDLVNIARKIYKYQRIIYKPTNSYSNNKNIYEMMKDDETESNIDETESMIDKYTRNLTMYYKKIDLKLFGCADVNKTHFCDINKFIINFSVDIPSPYNNLNTNSSDNFLLIMMLDNLVNSILKKSTPIAISDYWSSDIINFKSDFLIKKYQDTKTIDLNGDSTTINFGTEFILTSCLEEICSKIDLSDEKTQNYLVSIYKKSTARLIELLIIFWGFTQKNLTRENTYKKTISKIIDLLEQKNPNIMNESNCLINNNNHLDFLAVNDQILSKYYFDEVKKSNYVGQLDPKENWSSTTIYYNKYSNNIKIFLNNPDIKSATKLNTHNKILNIENGNYLTEEIITNYYYYANNHMQFLLPPISLPPSLFTFTHMNNIMKIYYFKSNIVFEHNHNTDSKTITNLITNKKYEIVEKTNLEILNIYLQFSDNIILLKSGLSYYLGVFISQDLNFTIDGYWLRSFNNVTFSDEHFHFIQINLNYFTFKFNSINDFHALFISFIKSQNSIGLQLLKNRIISDVVNIELHQNINDYTYANQIKILSTSMNIPFAREYLKSRSNIIGSNIKNIIDKLPNVDTNPFATNLFNTNPFDTNPPDTNIFDTNPPDTKLFDNLDDKVKQYLEKIKNLSELITSQKKNFVVDVKNNKLQNFINTFRSVCDIEDNHKVEIINLIESIAFDYIIATNNNKNVEDVEYIESITSIMYPSAYNTKYINSERIFSLNSVYIGHNYNKHIAKLYSRLITDKYLKIAKTFDDIKNDWDGLVNKCGEILRIISELDPIVIYNFKENRTFSEVLFELHNEMFLRSEQKEYLDNFNTNPNISTQAYEILMGKGKTSTLTPAYVLNNHLSKIKSYDKFIIVLPSHLVLSSYDIFYKIIDIFNKYTLRIIPVGINIENLDLGISNTITIISDSTLKHYAINKISTGIQLNKIFNTNKILFVFDEIDSLVNPLKSYLNIALDKSAHEKINEMLPILYQIAINIYLKKTDILLGTGLTNIETDPFKAQLYKTLGLILPIVLNFEFNKNYGFIDKKEPDNDEDNSYYKTVPYLAINSPVNGSEFSDFELSIILTNLSYLNNGLRPKDHSNIYDIFNLYYITENEMSKENFKEIMIRNYSLFEDCEDNEFEEFAFSLHSKMSNNINYNDEIEEIFITFTKTNKNKILLVFFYIIYFVQNRCFNFSDQKYNISTIDLLDTNITQNKICFSGTVNFNLFDKSTVSKLVISNDSTKLNEKLDELIPTQLNYVISSDSAQGELESAVTSFTTINTNLQKSNELSLTKEDIEQNLIKYLIKNISKYNALIDVGGYILKTKPIELVRKIYDKMAELNEIREILYINTKGVKMIYKGPDIPEQKYSYEIFDNVFIYYDNKNCIGIDFKQPYSMHGLVTIAPTNNLTEVTQGIYRLRNINIGHTVDYFVPEEFVSKESNKYESIYNVLKKKDFNDKIRLEKYALIQFVKFVKRNVSNYNSSNYKEKNYISTIAYPSVSSSLWGSSKNYLSAHEFLYQEIKSNFNYDFNKNSIQITNSTDAEINIDINININININIEVNKNIQIENSILDVILYQGIKKEYSQDELIDYFKSETEFLYGSGILNKKIKNIKLFDYDLVISQDVLSHIERYKKSSNNEKNYYKIFFQNLYFIYTETCIRIISFYECLLFKRLPVDYSFIIFDSKGNIILYNCNSQIDIEDLYSTDLYKMLGIILFGLKFKNNIYICTIAKYYNTNIYQYKNELLDILQSILTFNYKFNYHSVTISDFVKTDNFTQEYKGKELWEKIVSYSANIIEWDKFDKIWETFNKSIKQTHDDLFKKIDYDSDS